MAFTPVPAVATADLYTAANYNTYIKDNFAAGVPDIFTAAGDMAYATAADAATRLALGTLFQKLRVGPSNAPAWYGLNYAAATQQTADTTTSATYVNTSLSVNLTTVGTIAFLFLFNAFHQSTTGDNGQLAWNVDGGADTQFSTSANGTAVYANYLAVATGLSSAAHTFRIRFRRSAGSSGNYTFGSTINLMALIAVEL